MSPTTNNHPLPRWLRGSALSLAPTLALTLLNTVHAGVNFSLNAEFEDDTYVEGRGGGNYGANTAQPWSYWGGGSVGDPYPQAAIANPFPDENNPSPRVWANFNNPYYVNVAAQNNGSMRPATGMWLIPGATYHFHVQYYVPSTVTKSDGSTETNVVDGITPRAGITLSMFPSDPAGQETYLQPLNRNYFLNPKVEPPVGLIDHPVSPDITPDTWVTFDFDWVFEGPLPLHCNYPAFRIFGGDGRYIGTAAGTPPANPSTAAPNPGGYFDNCQISSDVYRDDLNGYVKDDSGNPIEGATVTLTSPLTTAVDMVVTLADGSYTLPTWAPHGYEFSVNAGLSEYTSEGSASQTVGESGNGAFPDIIMVAPSTGYDDWIAGTAGYFPSQTNPLVIGPGADPDKDGSTNIQEFGFNGNPNDPANNGQIYVLTADSSFDAFNGDKELILTAALRKGTGFLDTGTAVAASETVDGITYTIQGGLTLADGFTTPVWMVAPIDPGVAISGPHADEYEYRSFCLEGSDGLHTKGFLRAKAESSP